MNKIYKKNKSISTGIKYSIIFGVICILLLQVTAVQACGEPGGTPCATGSGTTSGGATGSGTTSGGATGSGTSSGGGTGSGTTSGGATGSGTTSATTNGVSVNTKIENPLGSSITDLPTFINVIVQFVLIIGIPIIVLAVIYAGFLFVTAQGNSEKLKKAKTTLLYTLIGAALLLGSFVIAKAIQGTVSQITS